MSDEAKRLVITITPMSDSELVEVVDFIRGRFGGKHLIHVINSLPSNTGLLDTPGWDEADLKDARRMFERLTGIRKDGTR